MLEASKYNVFPIDDRLAERFNSELAGRPEPVKGNRQVLYPGMGGLPQEGILNLRNRSHSITAEIVLPDGGAEGVIVNQGGFSADWVVYLKDGKLKYGYNLASLAHSYVEAPDPIPAGTHQVRMEFAYDGGGLAKGAKITLFIDGDQVGEGRLDATIPIGFSADETTDVGKDTGSRVVPDYEPGSTFTGQVNWVAIETGDDDHHHLITPEQQLAYHLAQH
jgi:arylsulfatase